MHATRVIKAVMVAISVFDAAQAAQLDNSPDINDAVAVRADKSVSLEKGSNVFVPPTLAASDPSPSPSSPPDITDAEEPPSATPKVPTEAEVPPTSKDEPTPSPSSPSESSPTSPAEAQPSPNPAGESSSSGNSAANLPTPAQPTPSGDSSGGVSTPPASDGLGGGPSGSGGSANPGGNPSSEDSYFPAGSGGSGGSSTPSRAGGVVADPGVNGSGGLAGSPGVASPAGSVAGGSQGYGGNASPSQASSMTTVWTPVIQTEVAFVTRTNSDGSTFVTATTTIATHTLPVVSPEAVKPTVKSKQTRNTVVGVVVGMGGAIVLGALGLVAFRIWGRKKNVEETDSLMDYQADLIVPEKSERGSTSGGEAPPRNPFQSTLENYHQPTPVNASSNF